MNIKNILKEHNKSFTTEREEIFNFMSEKHIFCSQDILSKFKEIGRASIFRTINLFLELWIVRRVSLWEKQETYELNGSNHHEHMKCEKCGDIIHFESESICKKIFDEAKKIWFQINEHHIWVIGTCKKCI